MPEPDLNLASAYEAIADELGALDALVHDGEATTWERYEREAAGLAGLLVEAGVGRGEQVALQLRNGPAYATAQLAAFKVRSAPVNVNHRYLEAELRYLLDNADAGALVVESDLAPRVAAVRHELPRLRVVVQVGPGELLPGAVRWADAVAHDPAARVRRSGDDLWLLYTGGTTGLPKGVMWPHRSLVLSSAPNLKPHGLAVPTTPAEAVANARALHAAGAATRQLAAAPLMHGTSGIPALLTHLQGGAVITVGGRSLDTHRLWAAVQRDRATDLTIVGDAFGRPLLAALEEAEAEGRPYDLSSLRVIVSSGVMWSAPVKEGLAARNPHLVLADLLGSSEGTGFARSVTRAGRPATTARFRLGEHARVLTDDGRDVQPGSGEVGVLAVGGPIPVGYYKDPEKTAATFREVGGRTWSIPGDFATVEADGTITLLGRGSVSINTGGEKVYPEEVEEALKTHPAVDDCNVVGVPDPTWGQAVTAVVALRPGAVVGEAELVAHARAGLAAYKCPKRVVFVDAVRRSPNGKADYRWATSVAGG